jgi:hypothetical protein
LERAGRLPGAVRGRREEGSDEHATDGRSAPRLGTGGPSTRGLISGSGQNSSGSPGDPAPIPRPGGYGDGSAPGCGDSDSSTQAGVWAGGRNGKSDPGEVRGLPRR